MESHTAQVDSTVLCDGGQSSGIIDFNTIAVETRLTAAWQGSLTLLGWVQQLSCLQCLADSPRHVQLLQPYKWSYTQPKLTAVLPEISRMLASTLSFLADLQQQLLQATSFRTVTVQLWEWRHLMLGRQSTHSQSASVRMLAGESSNGVHDSSLPACHVLWQWHWACFLAAGCCRITVQHDIHHLSILSSQNTH